MSGAAGRARQRKNDVVIRPALACKPFTNLLNRPRFTNLQAQLKHLYCGRDVSEYRECLIQPAGRIDHQLIVSEKANIDRVIATLGFKEMTHSIVVRKLCTLSPHHPSRNAVFEFDKLVRSIYTLRYLRDPQLQRNVHRSQNRIE